MIRFRHEDNAGGDPDPTPDPPVDPTPDPAPDPAPTWQGPSQEEWQRTQQAIERVSQFVAQQNQPPPDDDPEDMDFETYTRRLVEEMVAPMVPVYEATVKDQGEKRLRELHDSYEKEYGEFDRELAEAYAQKLMGSPGVGQDAVKAVEEGVKRAVEIAKRERQAGEEAYKASLKRGGHDFEPNGGGGGDRRIPDAKSYDEVIARWSGETEV